MKITDLKAYTVDADWRNWVFVKLFTDEGLTGVGEASLGGSEDQVVAALNGIKTYLIGKSPFDIEQHWRAIYTTRFWRSVVLLSALGGVEQALLDIVGKACGVPVYNLLGGRCRDRIRCYTHISEATSGHSVEQRAEEACQAVEAGWTAMKWDPVPPNYLALDAAGVRFIGKQMQAVRQAVGPDVDLMVEIHGRLDAKTAIRVAREIEPYAPFFMEEPVPPENLDALARVADAVDVPLATGERIVTKEAYWPLLERQLVDFIQPDVIHVGGLLQCRKIAAMAEARLTEVCPHNPNGPVATAAVLHLAASLPSFTVLEMPYDDYLWAARWRDELLVDPTPVQVKEGFLLLPTTPGLGVDLNEAAIDRYPARSHHWGAAFEAANLATD
ncbi:MAG: galactonate dehydratase [Chloroflexi bacterium]|nr:galactonate dehydratase [Chloroflexota bacterium]